MCGDCGDDKLFHFSERKIENEHRSTEHDRKIDLSSLSALPCQAICAICRLVVQLSFQNQIPEFKTQRTCYVSGSDLTYLKIYQVIRCDLLLILNRLSNWCSLEKVDSIISTK